MTRATPVRRVLGLLALVVVLGSQPQVLCGLHCALFSHMASHDFPSHASMPMGLCHAHVLTGGTVPQVGHLDAAWLPAGAAKAERYEAPVAAPAASVPSSHSAFLVPENPPPRV